MMAHTTVAAMTAEASAATETAANGASPAELDGFCSDEYPTIEHQVSC